jgi:Protein kinase domain
VIPSIFGQTMLERFRQEKQILADLAHPGIARLLDGGVNAEGLSYLVMEFVEGQPICQYAQTHVLNRADRLALFRRVCEAVRFAHQQRVIHRDIKPSNILVEANGQPKLLDFGIAKWLDENPAGAGTLWRAHTPDYASPEQVAGEPTAVASDIYQLGLLLFELLTGRRAEPGVDGNSAVDPQLGPIVAKCLRHDAAERYESVEALLAEVDGHAGRVGLRRGGKLRRWIWVAGLVVVLALGYFYWQRIRPGNAVQDQAAALRMIDSVVASQAVRDPTNAPDAKKELASIQTVLEGIEGKFPGNAVVAERLGQAYYGMGVAAWYRYGSTLLDAELGHGYLAKSRRLFEAAYAAEPGSAFTLQQLLVARFDDADILAELGRGWESFEEAAQVMLTFEAKLANQDAMDAAAVRASFYDMLSDRLSSKLGWPAGGEPAVAIAALVRLEPGRVADAAAQAVYEQVPRNGANTLAGLSVRLQLGQLQHEFGQETESARNLEEARVGFKKLSESDPYSANRATSARAQLARVAEAQNRLAEALAGYQEVRSSREALFSKSPNSLYLKERVVDARLSCARVLNALKRGSEARPEAALALAAMKEIAQAPNVSALSLDMAARRLLMLQPEELRDPRQAVDYARAAVRRTAGQMPAYQATLAYGLAAMGAADEAQRTALESADGYRRVVEILRPLFGSSRYPGAAAEFRELERRVESEALGRR